MKSPLPPIVKLAESAAVAVEQAVAAFPRRHRYTHGSILRLRAMSVWESSVKAWRDRQRQAQLIEQLSEKVDDLKLALQLGQRIKAFRSFGEFEAICRIVSDLGRQVGGWKKHVQRQNAAAEQHLLSQRPVMLSAEATSTFEVHP